MLEEGGFPRGRLRRHWARGRRHIALKGAREVSEAGGDSGSYDGDGWRCQINQLRVGQTLRKMVFVMRMVNTLDVYFIDSDASMHLLDDADHDGIPSSKVKRQI